MSARTTQTRAPECPARPPRGMHQIDVLPADKPLVAGLGALCAVQNFLFFVLYWGLWRDTSQVSTCLTTYFALGFDVVTCFAVCILVFGIVLGALINSTAIFALFFALHFLGGLCYTVAVVLVGHARFSADGKACAAISPSGTGDRIVVVWSAQVFLYCAYTFCMASIGYQAYGKRALALLRKTSPRPFVCDA